MFFELTSYDFQKIFYSSLDFYFQLWYIVVYNNWRDYEKLFSSGNPS